MAPLAIFGISNDALNLVVNLLILFLVVMWLALVWWTYADARRRIADPMLVATATAVSLFPFVGTIVYLVVRPPEYLEDARERELEIAAAEARLAQLQSQRCPFCQSEIERSFLRCPSCLRRLKEPCRNCGRPLDPRWRICPYCEAEVPESQPRRRTARTTPAAERPSPAERAGIERPAPAERAAASESVAGSSARSPRERRA
jgi:hypothetical protein